ncbi:MSMEG_4193 family putative phosphomutase [Pseudonocardiaceae bacterium YIM PH 21723]|nr:MSMEG_4193 family putative phosphomutase [Pseudonocardiaceae bacterium YIM PH 21723]
MATVILLRHARSTANNSGILAGRTPGVSLDDTGLTQRDALPGRLAGIPLVKLVRSPLQRCRETLSALAIERELTPQEDERFSEVDYGDWTGQAIPKLFAEPLWKVVQQHPSAAVFPAGEGLAEVQSRAVRAIREHDAKVAAEFGDDSVWLVCSHGDVIKSVLADALGMHLDAFQRIVVEPCSVSVIRYTDTRPFVLRMNDNSAAFEDLRKAMANTKAASDAVIGGSTGAP